MAKSSNINGVGIYIKNIRKVTEKSEYKIQSSHNTKVEKLSYEINKGTKSHIVGAIFRHPNFNAKDFRERLDDTLTLPTENRQIKNCTIF